MLAPGNLKSAGSHRTYVLTKRLATRPAKVTVEEKNKDAVWKQCAAHKGGATADQVGIKGGTGEVGIG